MIIIYGYYSATAELVWILIYRYSQFSISHLLSSPEIQNQKKFLTHTLMIGREAITSFWGYIG